MNIESSLPQDGSVKPANSVSGDGGFDEVPSLGDVLSAVPRRELNPPVVGRRLLPLGALDPPVFERLVAEVAMRVDGLPYVRVFGRSGQAQGGLDLYVGAVPDRTVYQVKRETALTPATLRTYVERYAGPPRRVDLTPVPLWQPRRLEARRFVLAVAASDDEAVDRELDRLQQRYAGDLEIELWRSTELAQMLVDRGPLVASLFGPAWAEQVCGYTPGTGEAIPSGRELLDDPITIHGLGGERDRAETLAAREPATAAQIYAQLAERMAAGGFAVLASQLRQRRRDLLQSAGDPEDAITATVEMLLEAYEEGRYAVHEVGPFGALAKLTGTDPFAGQHDTGPAASDADIPAGPPSTVTNEPTDGSHHPVQGAVVTVVTAMTMWAERGFEVPPVAAALETLAAAHHPAAAALAAAIAEQVIADDDPADDVKQLTSVVAAVSVSRPGGLLGTRLECATADLTIRGGTSTPQAYDRLMRRARTLDPSQEALVLRRAGYAHATAGLASEAVDLFQTSVIASSEARLGGDTRDALRAVADLTSDLRTELAARSAATATGNSARLLSSADDAALSTLENLADDHQHAALPKALFQARTWQRIERASGAYVEETIAHRRHAQVLLRAGETAAALRPLIRARQHELAAEAAGQVPWIDVLPFLRGDADHQRAACAVAATQADRAPDDRVDELAHALIKVAETRPIDPAKDALRALAALGPRLPDTVAARMLTLLAPSVTQPGHYGEQEALLALGALARYGEPSTADHAAGLLIQALAADTHAAVGELVALPPSRVGELESLAEQGHPDAIKVLAWWDQAHPALVDAARDGARSILAHPVGPQEGGHGFGPATQDHARALAAAVMLQIPEHVEVTPTAENADAHDAAHRSLPELVDSVVRHLLDWAADHHAIAASRSEALAALRVLRHTVDDELRAEAARRLLEIAIHPDLSAEDLAFQATTHPLSRITFNLGSEHFQAEALMTAAAYVATSDEAVAVAEQLAFALRAPELDDRDASYLAAAARQLGSLRPIPLPGLAGHPAAPLRIAAAWLATERSEDSRELLHTLAVDEQAQVRLAVANGLAARLASNASADAADATAVLERLRVDSSAAVRRAAREAITDPPS